MINLDGINYERLIYAAFFTPFGRHPVTNEIDWGARVVLRGPPGASKTARLNALAKRIGAKFYSLKPGAKGEGAFGVTPVPYTIKDGDGKEIDVIKFPIPDFVMHLNEGNKPALFAFDELNTAPPALQAAMLGGLQEKEFGSGHLGAHVRVIGATNETEDAAGGWDLAPAVANRLGHVDWPDPTVDEVKAYLIGGAENIIEQTSDANKIEKKVLDAWPEAWAKAAGQITAFLGIRPTLLRKQPNSGDPQASKAWPSPRTWEYATRALASSMVHNLPEDERDIFIASYIGEGACAELAAWLKDQDIPDPVSVLDGEEKFKHDKKRLDRTNAFLNSCVALVAPAKAAKRKERAVELWKVLGDVQKHAKDLTVPSMKVLADQNLTNFKEARPILAECSDMLKLVTSESV